MWVAQVDEAAVRNTRDVDIVIERARLNDAIAALEPEGFVYQYSSGVDMFLDGADAKARDAVHVVFAGEKVRSTYASAVPSIAEAQRVKGLSTFPLELLVRMKLTSFRLKDRVHLQDMISVGLIDQTWPSKYADALAERLQALLDDPDG
ncbi:MAG: hypothetical protein AAF805_04715 [Planctomycetota bacterium]